MSTDSDSFTIQRAKCSVKVTGFNTTIEIKRTAAGVYNPDDTEQVAKIVAKLLNRYAERKGHDMTNDPCVTIDAVFVEYGYQIDILKDSHPVSSSCRDFGGNHPIEVLKESFIQYMERAIDAFRNGTYKLPQIKR